MDIVLEKLQSKDAEKLFEFELKNRDFFEKMVPSRGDDYYHYEIFKKWHQVLLDEQEKNESYFYLIKDTNGAIVGRMNIVDIDHSPAIGHLGYRVGESYIGKGIATKALELLFNEIARVGVKQLLAKTTTNNVPSQKVLEKNGFERLKANSEDFDLSGRSEKFVYYMWTN